MKAPLLFILFIIVAINQYSSQPGIPEFGKVSPSELFQKEYSFEKEAPAYYLVNAANVEFKLYSDGSSRIKTELPPNMIVESVPKSILIRTEDSSMMYTRIINQRGLSLYISNEFTFKKSLFYSEEYPVLRDFFKKVYALLSEEVLFNKKE